MPVRLACRSNEAESDENRPLERFQAKPLGLPELTIEGQTAEYLGNRIARSLGVPTPRPVVVEITEPLANLISLSLREAGKVHSVQAGFAPACEFLAGGLAPPPSATALTEEEGQHAMAIFGFDMLCQNPDRLPSNPNCASYGRGLIAFDFELCFSHLWVPILGLPAKPWEVSAHGLASRHVFHKAMKQRSNTNWVPFGERMKQISDKVLNNELQALPAPWRTPGSRIVEHFKQVRDNAPLFVSELTRSCA